MRYRKYLQQENKEWNIVRQPPSMLWLNVCMSQCACDGDRAIIVHQVH